MKRLSLSGRMAVRFALGAAATGGFAAALIAPAYADRPLQLTYKEQSGYARITAKWGDGDDKAPKVTASVAAQTVLILRFDQKVTLNLDALKDALPNWVGVAKLDPDGMGARIGLKKATRAHVSTSVDLLAVDLIPEDDKANPPDIVSPLVAVRAAAAEKARIAAIPPPPPVVDLEVRGSQSDNSSRIAFYWSQPTTAKVISQGEGTLKLQFSRRAKADLAYLHITPPANLADPGGFVGENTDKGYVVTVTSKDKLPIKTFIDQGVFVIDITKPEPAAPAASDSDGKPAAKAAAKPVPAPAATPAKIEAGKPGQLTPPKEQKAEEQVAAEAAAQATPAVAVIGGPERVTAMGPSWTEPAPKSGVVDVHVAPLPSGVELSVAFQAPAPAAVFQRGSAVWAVFAADADLKVDPSQLPAGYRVRTQRGPQATMMRIETPKGITASAASDETSWTIRLAPTAVKPQRFLKPTRRPAGVGRARIETMLIGAAGVVWFEDPAIGDKIAVAVAYGPSSSSPTAQDFVEASLPATAHGLAVAPKSDDTYVSLEGERVVVSINSNGPATPEPQAKAKPDPQEGHAAFIDFAAWGKEKGKDFYNKRSQLELAAANRDPASGDGSDKLLALARFYLGHEMALEALGVLRMAVDERPDLEQDAHFLGLRGAADVLAVRLKEGDDSLSKGPLRQDGSAALWRGLIASQRGEWERAGDFFRQAGDQIYEYPPEVAARFAAAWAEAALNANDYDTARREAQVAAQSGKGEAAERAQLVLANLSAIIDGPTAAYPEFERISKQASEPIAVRAELKRLELAVPANKLSANDAASQLDSLRFRWRGDDVEMATVGILADQYMRVGRFRDALHLAQSTAMRDPNAPGARDLRIKLSDYFRRLFLSGEADRLDPIQSVGLFYEFEQLIPPGADGDQMVRKLAQRLVAFDLLGPAAELLQYQVDNRMRGTGKSVVAVDLARIYLMDKRPDRALAAINTTRQPNLPKELALERRLLEAAGYLDLGRYDHVIELVEPLDGVEAKSLLAEAYWRGRNWADAARAYVAMLPPPGQAKPENADIALKAAIAARMSKDPLLIAQLRSYAGVFANNPNKASFDLITSQIDTTGAAISEAVRRQADAPHVDAFAAAMKKSFAPTPAAAPAAAPKPAAPAAAPAATPKPAQAAAAAPAAGAKGGSP